MNRKAAPKKGRTKRALAKTAKTQHSDRTVRETRRKYLHFGLMLLNNIDNR